MIKDLMDKDIELTTCILYITPDLMDQFPVGEDAYGMQVRIGKEFVIKEKEKEVVKTPVQAPTKASDRIYWFKGQDGLPFHVEEQAAWDIYSGNSSWKYKPQYLGVTHKNGMKELLAEIQEKHPVNVDWQYTVNSGIKSPESSKAERELNKIAALHKELYEEGIKKIAATADPSVTPPNKDYLFADKTMTADQQALARSLTGRM